MNLRALLISREYHTAMDRYGANAVQEEIEAMVFDSLASVALFAADYFGYKKLGELAARTISNSGCYSKEAHELAERYL